MFNRPRHRAIAEALKDFDAGALARAECYFGGGTAISLLLGEYRESVDIDFLCSSKEGWRAFRAMAANDLSELAPTATLTRNLMHTANATRTVIRSGGVNIKVEFVREGRVDLSGAFDETFRVPTLSKQSLQTQKLLANADRGLDVSTNHRDLIDYAMMLSHWGRPGPEPIKAAVAEYGEQISDRYHAVFGLLLARGTLPACLLNMSADPALSQGVIEALETGMNDLPLSESQSLEWDRRSAVLAVAAASGNVGEVFLSAAKVQEAKRPGEAVNWFAVERIALEKWAEDDEGRPLEMSDFLRGNSPGCASTTRQGAVQQMAVSLWDKDPTFAPVGPR